MKHFHHRSRGPHGGQLLLGLDVGTGSIKAVALGPGAHGARLVAVDLEPLAPDGGADAAAAAPPEPRQAALGALRRLLDRMQIAPQQIGRLATAVGGANVTVGEFEMPHMKPRDLRRAIPWEARKHLPDDARVFDYEMLAGRSDDMVHIMLASVPQPQLEQQLGLMRAAGLEPERVEAVPIALSLACRGLRGDVATDSCVILDIGCAGTTLVIGEEAGPFFCRYLDIGLGSHSPVPVLAGPGGEAAPCTPEDEAAAPAEPALVQEARAGEGALLEELMLELRRSMAFFGSHFNTTAFQRIIVSGGGATFEPLVAALGTQLGIPITRFAYRGNRAVPRLEAPYAVAYGLAMRLGR